MGDSEESGVKHLQQEQPTQCSKDINMLSEAGKPEYPENKKDRTSDGKQHMDKDMSMENKGTEEQCASFEEAYYPYVVMRVEELSVVTSLENWTNLKVRVPGEFLLLNSSEYYLREIGGAKELVRLNLNSLAQYPKHGDIVDIFGELHAEESVLSENLQGNAASAIIIKVLFFNKVHDFNMYTQILSLLKPYIPMFIKREK